ncbi:MAG: tRNA1(Val) (adenine(37)-N6)-methyltransferase [Bacteroidetes bacterium ADurb.Bin217]|nr:MAG: tRNA1(Val) (adenine(37)-N6)-methyltransferase [Bacteroidetes bacterium ADurb.Bin217]
MSYSTFVCKEFSIIQNSEVLKLGTDAIILGCLSDFHTPTNILDIGTGTGILTLMMAQKYRAQFTAIDILHESFICASHNFTQSKWSDFISCKHISLQDFCLSTQETFDGIICNPPFFSHSLHNKSTFQTIARHSVALSPIDLFACSQILLSPKGIISIIIPYSEKQTFCEQALYYNLYTIKETLISPFFESNPNRIVLHFSKTWNPLESSHIYIRNKDKTYSEVYKELTKKYISIT